MVLKIKDVSVSKVGKASGGPILGKMLGDVTADDLMVAIYAAKVDSDGGEELGGNGFTEVYASEGEEE